MLIMKIFTTSAQHTQFRISSDPESSFRVFLRKLISSPVAFLLQTVQDLRPQSCVTSTSLKLSCMHYSTATAGVVLQNPLSVFLTKSNPKPFVSSTILSSSNLSNLFPIVVYLEIFPSFTDTSRALLSGDQGYSSCSSEACLNHQMLILRHNMQFTERLAFLLLSGVLQLAIFQISLSLSFRFLLSSFYWGFV